MCNRCAYVLMCNTKQDYLDKYYSGEVLAWFDALKNSPLTTEQPVSPTKCTHKYSKLHALSSCTIAATVHIAKC
jgi:hypothetical protein